MSFHTLTKASPYLIKFGLAIFPCCSFWQKKMTLPMANFTRGKEREKEINACEAQTIK